MPVREEGIGPSTSVLSGQRSTTELLAQNRTAHQNVRPLYPGTTKKSRNCYGIHEPDPDDRGAGTGDGVEVETAGTDAGAGAGAGAEGATRLS